ncbi:uncharacterized protein LOC122304021 [Carya illinoinensis]|uniref:uncharacterized protein LOC122304021 n=1 Tax=Carya illinoinensis TaxID=32201 RepID=UPI001C729BDD|nr:uncharacterized protein LOC122304021 [Carya illinoinensis]
MDVTFFEQQPYFPKSDIQGETNFIQEYQLWDIEESPHFSPNSDQPCPSLNHESIPPQNLFLESPYFLESPPQDQTNNPPQNLDTIQSTKNDELITYSRRRKNQKEMEQEASLEQTQESDPSPRSSEDPSGS